MKRNAVDLLMSVCTKQAQVNIEKPKVVIITLTKSGGMIREKKENERSDES